MKVMSPPPYNPVSAPDYLPEDKLRELQTVRFKQVLERAYNQVLFYRQRLDEAGVAPDSFVTLADVRKFPFTVKADLRNTYPFGLFASPLKEIVRLHASSGTTGKPIVVAYTREDLQIWTNAMVRAYASAGITAGDIMQISFGYGLFTGGLGAHYGAETLGATVIPASGGNTERQVMLLKDFGATVISCTPSYFVHLAEAADKMGVDLRRLPLRIGVFGAEPWSPRTRRFIEDAAGIKAYDIYGLSEITGPGVAAECECQEGLHVFEDYFYPEIVDPDTLEALPDGEEGELVITTLMKTAMPLIRYRTRDLSRLITEKCPCGRTIRRIARLVNRSDDMFIVRGVNIFPSQIEAAIQNEAGQLLQYQIVLTRTHGLDEIAVLIEVKPEMLSDKVSAIEDVTVRFERAIEKIINIRAAVKMLPPNSLERSSGKMKRVIDRRSDGES